MANGDVDITEGSGLKVGTYTISEDAVTRHLQRITLNNSSGVEVSSTSRLPTTAGGITVVKSVTLSTDTSAYANGDIIADTQQVDAALRVSDGTGMLQSISIFDADDQTPYSFTIFIHRTSTSMGSENSGITISDANAAAGIIGAVSFTSGDCFDLINGRMYFRSGLGIPLVAVSGTDDIYISMVCVTGTPTHTASGVTALLSILQD
jgi:hypothetical protein